MKRPVQRLREGEIRGGKEREGEGVGVSESARGSER